MANISMDSVSGLSPEFQKAYAATLQAERKPIQRIVDHKTNSESKVKLLDDLIGKVEGVKKLMPDLTNSVNLRELAVSSSNDKVLVGSAEKGKADIGSYDLEVLELASKTSAVSNSFEDRDETRIGSGYFKVDMPNGETKELFVDDANSTLDGMAKVINTARLGVHASVVRDREDEDAPFRLMLMSDKTGENNNVEFPEIYFVGGEEDFYIDSVKPAGNARLKFEGQEVESPSNQLKDLIAGVTVNLKGLSDGRSTTLQVGQDTPKIAEKVKTMVDKLNEVLGFIQSQNKIDQNTDTKKTLGGDYGIRMAESRIYGALHENLGLEDGGREFRALTDIGIQVKRDGTLNYDQKKFEAAIEKDYEGVAELLCGNGITTGIMNSLNRVLGSIAGGPTAVLSSERKNLNENMSRMQREIDDKEVLMERKADALKMKLAKAQEALSTLKGQASQMQAQLGGGGGPAAEISQLMGG